MSLILNFKREKVVNILKPNKEVETTLASLTPGTLFKIVDHGAHYVKCEHSTGSMLDNSKLLKDLKNRGWCYGMLASNGKIFPLEGSRSVIAVEHELIIK